jgi:NAD(P)-dependent dehydrogenase (short-subunit alcohol dehydrogenase family)
LCARVLVAPVDAGERVAAPVLRNPRGQRQVGPPVSRTRFIAAGDGPDLDAYDATAGNGDARLAAIGERFGVDLSTIGDALAASQVLDRRDHGEGGTEAVNAPAKHEDPQRIAVVTGGAGAIGGAIVAALKAGGHRVAVIDRDAEISADLGDEASTRRAAAEILDRFGRCDVLVHAAAAFDVATLADLDAATWRRIQAVNVESALWLAQVFTPGMAERGFGRIVFLASDTFWEPPAPMLVPYVASKGAVIGITRALARALGPDGIAVTAVAPGLTDTPGSRTVNTDVQFDAAVERQALKRRLTPADAAAAVAFLATDGAAALTGQTLITDGGLVLH